MSDEFPLADRDGLLALLYGAFCETGLEVGMTFLVGGQWITGMTVSGRLWFENVAQVADSGGAGIGVAFKTIGQAFYPSESEVDAGVVADVPDDRPIGYLHLRAARRLGESGSWSPEEGTWLRVRLSQVDAWHLGNLMPGDRPGAFDPMTPSPE